MLARAVVHSFCTQKPMPREYDLWARAPVSETGPFVFGGDEEEHYRGRRFARGGSPSSHSETRTPAV